MWKLVLDLIYYGCTRKEAVLVARIHLKIDDIQSLYDWNIIDRHECPRIERILDVLFGE